MKRKTKITLAALSAALVVLSAAPRLVQAEDSQTIALKDAIRTVVLHGDGTALKLTTHEGTTREALLITEDNIGCPLTSSVQADGDQLQISVQKGPMRIGFWCDPDVTLSLPSPTQTTAALSGSPCALATIWSWTAGPGCVCGPRPVWSRVSRSVGSSIPIVPRHASAASAIDESTVS